jgi:hypothetical protein
LPPSLFATPLVSCASTGGTSAGSTTKGGYSSPAVATSCKAGWGPHGKPLYYFMVQSNAVPGREDEFNTWYDRIHAPIVIEEDDFVWAQRFELSAYQFAGNGTPELKQRRFLVIFGVEANDIKGTLAAVNKRLAQYRNVQSSSMAPSLQAVSWKTLGPPITQKDAQLLLVEEEAANRVPKRGTPAPPGFRGRGGGPGAGGPPPGDGPPPGAAPPAQ